MKYMLFDASQAESWRRVKRGAIITLSDLQTLMDLMNWGTGMTDLDLRVERVFDIRTEPFNMIIFDCSGHAGDKDIRLLPAVKIVDEGRAEECLDVRVYFRPEGFEPGTREQLLGNEAMRWIFAAPESGMFFQKCKGCGNPNQTGEDIQCSNCGKFMFVPAYLYFVGDFYQDDDTSHFIVKQPGTVYGEVNDGSGDPKPIAVVEYATDNAGCPNPEALVVEIGGLNAKAAGSRGSQRRPEGGLVKYFNGINIEPTGDIRVLA
jgi:hypothetical protein